MPTKLATKSLSYTCSCGEEAAWLIMDDDRMDLCRELGVRFRHWMETEADGSHVFCGLMTHDGSIVGQWDEDCEHEQGHALRMAVGAFLALELHRGDIQRAVGSNLVRQSIRSNMRVLV